MQENRFCGTTLIRSGGELIFIWFWYDLLYNCAKASRPGEE